MTLPNDISIGHSLAHLKQIAPGGFAIGLHIHFAAPKLMFNCYPPEWVSTYAKQGLLLRDPTVRWAMTNEGVCPWQDIDPSEDPLGVMTQAAGFGLRHGVSISMVDGARSLGGLAHPDRPFEAAEIAEARAELARLHELTRDVETLGPAMRARLGELSIEVVTS